ncbi:hypothetical protein G7Y89_g13079 [Cudoniella acicularis]|uniref:Zn(2)-C6 fungal-type domain-containing protein n=1 Tax=Cudoniella acicularis TaxID=354080 RepID=A0A8H4VWD8_9HELO|nr:hypothetical protein G7Y89_g13079 [Cudoniella acicularis]
MATPSKQINGYTNGNSGPHPLRIAIVGAGIGGLTAAIILRRNGHHVSVYEQSSFASETGAAIHLAPNSNGILRRFGINAEDFGAVEMRALIEYDARGEEVRRVDLIEPNKIWQHPWQLVHRVPLHETLKRLATDAEGVGKPVELHVSSKVLEVDTGAAVLRFENGEIVEADLVLGADGIYSKTRSSVTGKPSNLFPSGKAAFRFLISRKVALADTETAKLFQRENELAIWYGQDRRVVMYPCDGNELLNFVCIHPDSESQGGTDEWNKQGSIEQLLKIYWDFDPKLLSLFHKADPESLKVWKLLDMETLPTWVKGRLALLGDAAHPFLPHQGQGGGIAMEDAAALGVVLPFGTTIEEIPDRLKLYETIRLKRANTIQEYSRQAGKDMTNGQVHVDMMEYTNYNFGHDEWDNSTNIFTKWLRAKNPGVYWRSPVAFGPSPGPRQDILGKDQPSLQQTFVTASIKFKTSRTFLQNLFPTASFKFQSHGTVAYASFSVTTLGNMTWLGGGGYNHFGLYIHGVTYTKADGSVINGTYMPVLFENLADPIITGRDELGMPKIYCAIDTHRRKHGYHMSAGWQGAKFCDFHLEGLEEVDASGTKGTIGGEDDEGILVYRYVPKVGIRGEADVEYPVVVPHKEESKKVPSTVKSVSVAKKASIKFDKLDQEALPTVHYVVSVLADIPCYEVVSAKVVEGDFRSASDKILPRPETAQLRHSSSPDPRPRICKTLLARPRSSRVDDTPTLNTTKNHIRSRPDHRCKYRTLKWITRASRCRLTPPVRPDSAKGHFSVIYVTVPTPASIIFRGTFAPRHFLGHASDSTAAQRGQPVRQRRVSQACSSCAAAKLKCKEEKPCQRCLRKGIVCEYNEPSSVNQMSCSFQAGGNAGQPEISTIDPNLPVENRDLTDIVQQPVERMNNLYPIDEVMGENIESLDAMATSESTQTAQSHTQEDNALADFINDIMGSTMLPSYDGNLENHGTATPSWAYRDLLDFGLEENMQLNDSDYVMMDYYQGRTQSAPVAALQPENVDLPASGLEGPKSNTKPRGSTGMALGIDAFRKSLWCWTPALRDRRPSFALPQEDMGSPENHFPSHIQIVNEKLGAGARDKLVAMVLQTCDRVEFPKVMSSFPTVDFLEALMQSFLASHVAQRDSWIHLPTMRIETQRPELIGGFISAGAFLSTSLTIRKLGFAIHEAVRTSFSKTFEADNSLTRDLGLLQAFALNLDQGLWSGNKRQIELAESLAQVLTTMNRRRGRFLRSSYPATTLSASDEGAVLDDKWRLWVQRESFKRLVFHLFVRDAQTSMSLLINTSISYAELSLPLPECRKLWLAETASEWKAIYLSMGCPSSDRIPSLPQCLHNTSPLTETRSLVDLELSTTIISYGIWGLIQEFRRLSSVLKAHHPAQLYNGVLILGHRHQELSQLLLHFGMSASGWNSEEGMSASAKMILQLLFMHLHVSFDDLQLFAGREGEEEASRVYPSLQQWVASREARQAMWHAGQVIRSAKELPPHQLQDFNAIAVYHASLAFWVYGVLSINSGQKTPTKIGSDSGGVVWLDGLECPESTRFIELNKGRPCFSAPAADTGDNSQPTDFAELSNPEQVMVIIQKIFRERTGREDQNSPLPALLDNLSQLVRELGSAAAILMQKSGKIG